MRIGVDIGGSGVRAAPVQAGAIAGSVVRRRLPDRDPATVVRTVCDAVHAIGRPTAVGVGVPGFVRDGVVLGSPNFPGWEGEDLRGRLAGALGVPVSLANDANVAALGAWRSRGASEDLVLLTLGTGVGGGLVLGGRLWEGSGGTGAEVGHIHVGGTRRCGCGGVGCLETFVGTAGLRREAAARGLAIADGAELVDHAEAGHPIARALLAEAAEHLGKGLVTLVNLLAPDVIVLAGGLAAARTWLAPAEAWLRTHGVPPSVERVQVVWGGRAETWAIVGAAALGEDPRP